MGFSLEMMIEDLQRIIKKEQKAHKTLKELNKQIAWWKNYAKECGQLK